MKAQYLRQCDSCTPGKPEFSSFFNPSTDILPARRSAQKDARREPNSTVLIKGDLRIYPEFHQDSWFPDDDFSGQGETPDLSPLEFKLPLYLVRNEGRILSREQILGNQCVRD